LRDLAFAAAFHPILPTSLRLSSDIAANPIFFFRLLPAFLDWFLLCKISLSDQIREKALDNNVIFSQTN
jgi:hypothetical protein